MKTSGLFLISKSKESVPITNFNIKNYTLIYFL